jgi:hypothetical protein
MKGGIEEETTTFREMLKASFEEHWIPLRERLRRSQDRSTTG